MGFAKLIRNLRKGVGMFPAPVEIKALAQLLTERGVDVELCRPGDNRSTLNKLPVYRLICDSLYELAIVGGDVSIHRLEKFTAYDLPAVPVYELSVPLADPTSIDKLVTHIRG